MHEFICSPKVLEGCSVSLSLGSGRCTCLGAGSGRGKLCGGLGDPPLRGLGLGLGVTDLFCLGDDLADL